MVSDWTYTNRGDNNMIDKLNEELCVEKHLKFCMSKFITHEKVNDIDIPIEHICFLHKNHTGLHQCKYCPRIYWEDLKEKKGYEKENDSDKEIMRYLKLL